MKIAYLAAGAGGMFCGTCLHDNTLARAMMDQGHDVLLIPTYTPLRTDEPDVSQPRIFFGGINVYLQQKLAAFRHTPWWFDRLLDGRKLLQLVSRNASSTEPARLGDLTVSMIDGELGHQRKELEKLVRWLADEVRPDVVHLSNTMLLGMARQLRARVQAPVVCSLSGEDIFLDRLAPPYLEQAKQKLIERAVDADAFVALNRYYADAMIEWMQLDPQRVHVIPHGLDLQGHGDRPERSGEELTVGYLARICPDKGLHLLVEAFEILAQDESLPPLRLRAAGYLGESDRAYLEAQSKRLDEAGLASRFEYLGELDRAEKIAFLQSLDVMALPTVYRESKGLPVLEAWANGVPVVLPGHGSFPEMVADTGGGLLCEPEDPASLAAEIRRLVLDPGLAREHGLAGQAAVRDRYHAPAMARRTLELYETLVAARRSSTPSSPLD